jgi:RNase P/RNase MRP subunit POP5
MIFFEAGSGRGLLRCEHKQVAQVKAAILKLKRAGSRNVAFNILGVSGTIRAAKRKFLPAL